jgi:hypothetical protein
MAIFFEKIDIQQIRHPTHNFFVLALASHPNLDNRMASHPRARSVAHGGPTIT